MLTSMISDKLNKLDVEGSINPAQYGLDQAKRFIEILGNNKKERLVISDKKTYDGKFYLKYADKEAVYLASSTWDQWINRKAGEVRNKKFFSNDEKIKKVTINEGKKQIILEKVGPNWVVDGDKSYPLDESKVHNLIDGLHNFRAADVVSEEKENKNLEKFNLKKPALKINIEFEENQNPVEINVSQIPKDAGDVYLNLNSRPFVYKTYKSIAEKWKVSKSDFKKTEEKRRERHKKRKHSSSLKGILYACRNKITNSSRFSRGNFRLLAII